MDDAKQARLDAQWPKICGKCGLIYQSLEDFRDRTVLLPRLHIDEFATQEYRNCSCGSTLVALIEIHDLSAE